MKNLLQPVGIIDTIKHLEDGRRQRRRAKHVGQDDKT
jgi:hypothetical protein